MPSTVSLCVNYTDVLYTVAVCTNHKSVCTKPFCSNLPGIRLKLYLYMAYLLNGCTRSAFFFYFFFLSLVLSVTSQAAWPCVSECAVWFAQ